MPYHSHILNSSTHSHIIGRTDPITGDSVKENDSVVFCSNCQSCFLEDSWKYMNEIHCEQNRTLSSVPTKYSNITVKNKEDRLLHSVEGSSIYITILLSIFYFAALYSVTLNYPNRSLILLASIAFGGIASTFTSFFIKRFTTLGIKSIRIFKNRIEIKNEISFWKTQIFFWKDVKQIKFQRRIIIHDTQLGNQITSNSSVLLLYSDDEQFLQKELPDINNKQSKKLLEALEKVSHFTKVLFYSESWEELQIMKKIKSQSKGDIQIRKPKRVFDANTRPVHSRLYS